MEAKERLSPEQCEELLSALQTRFEKKPNECAKVQAKLEAHPEKVW